MSVGDSLSGRYQLAELLKQRAANKGIRIDLRTTDGSVETIAEIQSGKLDVGIVQGGLTTGTNVKPIAAIFAEPLHLLVRRDIDDFFELRGKRINLSQDSSGTRDLAKKILEFGGLSPEDYIDTNLSYDQLKTISSDSVPDAAFMVSALPFNSARTLIDRHYYKILSIPFWKAFSETNVWSKRGEISSGMYGTNPMVPQDDVVTIATEAAFVVNSSVPSIIVADLLSLMYSYDFQQQSPIKFNEIRSPENWLLLENATQSEKRAESASFIFGLFTFLFGVFLSTYVAYQRRRTDTRSNLARILQDISSRRLSDTTIFNRLRPEEREVLSLTPVLSSALSVANLLAEEYDITPEQLSALAIECALATNIEQASKLHELAVKRSKKGRRRSEALRLKGQFHFYFEHNQELTKRFVAGRKAYGEAVREVEKCQQVNSYSENRRILILAEWGLAEFQVGCLEKARECADIAGKARRDLPHDYRRFQPELDRLEELTRNLESVKVWVQAP